MDAATGERRRRAVARLDVRRPAASARAGARTCARARASPAATSTAASPSTPWRTSASASRSPTAFAVDLDAAPLLCAGLIGHRALRMAGDAAVLGLYGFGAAAHIVCQVAVHEGRRVLAFTRAGDAEAQAFARELGAAWAGPADERPEELDAAIIFAPAGELVPVALRAVAPRRHRGVRGHPHERHPVLPVRRPVGRADAALRREPHAAPTARRSSPSRRGCRSARPSRRYPLERAGEALEDLRARPPARRRGPHDRRRARSGVRHSGPVRARCRWRTGPVRGEAAVNVQAVPDWSPPMTRHVSGRGGIAASLILIAFGIGALVHRLRRPRPVRSELAREQIVGTPDSTIPGQKVDTGSEAQAFAAVMRKHTLEATGGQTYSQMGRFLDESGKPTERREGRRRATPRAASRSRTRRATSGSARRPSRPRSTRRTSPRASRPS